MVQRSSEKSIAATMILRGCNCNIAFSESVESENGSNDDVDDLFEEISIDEWYKTNWVHGIHDLV